MFGVKQYWHKRIVRSGINTLCPYSENPNNLVIQKDDILFLDFGPIFDGWEADLGRTYVLGKDPIKLKLLNDVEECWHIAYDYFNTKNNITASKLYEFVCGLAESVLGSLVMNIRAILLEHFHIQKLMVIILKVISTLKIIYH